MQDPPTVGVRTQVRTVRTHAQTESAISPPRPASALRLRGSCALWAVRTCSGGGLHWPARFAQYAPCSDVRSIRFTPVHCRPMSTRFSDGKARQ